MDHPEALPPFEPSEEALADATMLDALAVPAEERWAHIGKTNPALARQLLALRSQLAAQGIPAVDIEIALVSFVFEVGQIDKSREATVSEEPEEIASSPDAEVFDISWWQRLREHRRRKDVDDQTRKVRGSVAVGTAALFFLPFTATRRGGKK